MKCIKCFKETITDLHSGLCKDCELSFKDPLVRIAEALENISNFLGCLKDLEEDKYNRDF